MRFSEFELQHNGEVYCFLKRTLPRPYEVIAEPSTEYYSEWLFRYAIRCAGEEVAVLAGDYRELKPGQLVDEARQLVRRLTEGNSC